MMQAFYRALLICCTLFSAPALIAQNSRLEQYLRDSLDIVMNRELQRWGIPGAAVCVVKGDQVLVSKGYGKRAVDNPQQVESTTYTFTAANGWFRLTDEVLT